MKGKTYLTEERFVVSSEGNRAPREFMYVARNLYDLYKTIEDFNGVLFTKAEVAFCLGVSKVYVMRMLKRQAVTEVQLEKGRNTSYIPKDEFLKIVGSLIWQLENNKGIQTQPRNKYIAGTAEPTKHGKFYWE